MFPKPIFSKSLIHETDKMEPRLKLRGGIRRAEDPLAVPPAPPAALPEGSRLWGQTSVSVPPPILGMTGNG